MRVTRYSTPLLSLYDKNSNINCESNSMVHTLIFFEKLSIYTITPCLLQEDIFFWLNETDEEGIIFRLLASVLLAA